MDNNKTLTIIVCGFFVFVMVSTGIGAFVQGKTNVEIEKTKQLMLLYKSDSLKAAQNK